MILKAKCAFVHVEFVVLDLPPERVSIMNSVIGRMILNVWITLFGAVWCASHVPQFLAHTNTLGDGLFLLRFVMK